MGPAVRTKLGGGTHEAPSSAHTLPRLGAPLLRIPTRSGTSPPRPDEALEQEEYDRWEDYGERQARSSHMEAYGRLQDDDDDDLRFGRFIP